MTLAPQQKSAAPKPVSEFSALVLPTPLNSVDQKEFERALRILRSDIKRLTPALEELLRGIDALDSKEPIDNILIDDASGRFVGLAVSKLLQHKRSSRLPIDFLKVEKEQLPFNTKALEKIATSNMGHTLLITEYISSGAHIKQIDRAFARHQKKLSIGALLYTGDTKTETQTKALNLAAENLIYGLTTSQCPLETVYTNHALNGVTTRRNYSPQRILMAANIKSWIKSENAFICATETAPRHRVVRVSSDITKQKLINYSRCELNRIVQDYLKNS